MTPLINIRDREHLGFENETCTHTALQADKTVRQDACGSTFRLPRGSQAAKLMPDAEAKGLCKCYHLINNLFNTSTRLMMQIRSYGKFFNDGTTALLYR